MVFYIRPCCWQTICSSGFCTCPGIGGSISNSWSPRRTPGKITGREKVILVLGIHLSNFLFSCRQDCSRGYRASIPQGPLRDGDSRIPRGQEQCSECGMSGHCRRGDESRWVKTQGFKAQWEWSSGRKYPGEERVASSGCLVNRGRRLRQRVY